MLVNRLRISTLLCAIALTVALTVALSAPARGGQPGKGAHGVKGQHAKAQTTCPVMGGAVDRDLYVEKDGRRIYLCCKGCIGKVEADFDKYAKKIEARGETVAHVQANCPVMGGPVDKGLYVDQGGKRIYVCCKGCLKPVRENFEENAAKIRARGSYVADTPKAVR